MKTLLLLLLTVSLSYGQASLYGKKIKGPLTLANGDQINVGDTVYFGRGTMPNGNFKFITNPANVLVGVAEMPFDASWRGLKAAITGFRRYENNQFGTKTYVIAYTGRNALIEIEPAIEMGEVIGVGDKQFVVSESAKPSASVADEILKLKQLLDAGAITQSEYDSQKKKLLGN